MKAMLWTDYGPPDVLQPGEIEKPTPTDNEVLIRVRASTVTAGDCELRRFDLAGWIWLPVRLYMGLLKPRVPVLGQELAGEIEAVGKEVSTFKPGDMVFCSAGIGLGGYAEYKCQPVNKPMVRMPENMSFAEAATISTGCTNGLHFLRKAKVKPGDSVLINGAGGSIGTYAVQLAKMMGAEVTAVDSKVKLEMLRSIGADHVIDYQQEDFAKRGERYDVIIDIAGYKSYSGCVKSLRKNGRFVLGNPRLGGMLRSIWTSLVSDKKAIVALAGENNADFLYFKELIEAGKLKAVIDRQYKLEELVEAHQYVETGQKAGNVVITIG